MISSDFVEYPYAPFQDSKGDLRLQSTFTDDWHSSDFALACYPDHEGVQNNGGRIGAAEAPARILHFLGKMTPPAFSNSETSSIGILGQPDKKLNHFEKLETGKNHCLQALRRGQRWIGLGGGHDYGYCEGAGFLEAHSKNALPPLIVNFDAHLDVRPFDANRITSGTPFFRLLETYKDFEFVEVGIRDFCNRIEHARWAAEKGAKLLTLEQMRQTGPLESFLQQLGESFDFDRPIFISVDIDAFSSDLAMGCSQSWPSGMTWQEFDAIYRFLLQRGQARALGIYEVSPPLDLDDRTSKLAAEIAYMFLCMSSSKASP